MREARARDQAFLRVTLKGETDIGGWREKARALLAAGVGPSRVVWDVEDRVATGDLLAQGEAEIAAPQTPRPVRIARELLATIESALLHSAEDRFALAYDIVFRAQAEPRLHRNPADAGVRKLAAYAKAVRRDIHKMHAFVRFRKAGETDGRERFAAWFEPDHHITEAVAPFFRNRFAGMDWAIVTPEASISWDGRVLRSGPGGSRADAPREDGLEEEWRSYYAHIFNPARLKLDAMRAEMPVKYWKNLPEAELIAPLARSSGARTAAMIAQVSPPALFAGERPDREDAMEARFGSLDELYDALARDETIPRDDFAGRIVRGEGPADARLMLVGEQPGDVEDREGRAFVGPAGKLLDAALDEAGIARREVFVTNAVKRFKFEQRGKRRIHRTPNAKEIEHYRWWLEQERLLVAPEIVVALGGTAARALTGKPVKIAQMRGRAIDQGEGGQLLVTVHPSYLLRIPDEKGRQIERAKFVRDLELAAKLSA